MNWGKALVKGRGITCPVCGHDHVCVIKHDGAAVGCFRVREGCAKRRDGSDVTFRGGMGWIHDLLKSNFKPRRRPIRNMKAMPKVHPFVAELAKEFHGNMTQLEAEALGEILGVSGRSLMRLRVGWCKKYNYHELDLITGELKDPIVVGARAFSFPMRDANRQIIGIRFRNLDGYKWAAKGSQNGLFVPAAPLPPGPLLIVEGPSETATVDDWGFAVIGRPGNTAGREQIVEFCKNLRSKRHVVILRNNDPAGSRADILTRDAAHGLAGELLACGAALSVRIMAPPQTKDARDWKKTGATKADVLAVIHRTPLWRPPTEHRPTLATPACDRGLRARRVA